MEINSKFNIGQTVYISDAYEECRISAIRIQESNFDKIEVNEFVKELLSIIARNCEYTITSIQIQLNQPGLDEEVEYLATQNRVTTRYVTESDISTTAEECLCKLVNKYHAQIFKELYELKSRVKFVTKIVSKLNARHNK